MNHSVEIKNLERPLVLVGLMGAGKTTLGKKLAQALDLDFIDSDNLIIEREGCSIADIFKKSGEAYFRQMEQEVLTSLIGDKGIRIIGTGGGAFMNDAIRKIIKEKTTSIFLKADLDVLTKRIGSGEERPLFKGKNVKDVLHNLMAKRYPIYEEADISIETKDEPLQETLNRVQQALYSHPHVS